MLFLYEDFDISSLSFIKMALALYDQYFEEHQSYGVWSDSDRLKSSVVSAISVLFPISIAVN